MSKVKQAVEKHIGDKISKVISKKGAKDDDNDDPIEKSLNERIALGGVTQVAKGVNPVKPVVSKPVVKAVKDKNAEEEKTGDNKLTKAVEKNLGDKVGKMIGGKKAGKDDDTDDPIA